MVYLSRFIGQGLAELQQAATLAEGQQVKVVATGQHLSSSLSAVPAQALRRIAQQPVPVPGERGFALEGITERPQTGADTGVVPSRRVTGCAQFNTYGSHPSVQSCCGATSASAARSCASGCSKFSTHLLARSRGTGLMWQDVLRNSRSCLIR